MRREAFKILALVTAVNGLPMCSRDPGYLYRKVPVKHVEEPGSRPDFSITDPKHQPVTPPPAPKGYKSLTWLLQCPTNPLDVPESTADDLVIVDAGPFSVPRSKLDGTPVTVKGRVCTSEGKKRDIIFIIDESSSMAENDPVNVFGTCGRLDAINAVFNEVAEGEANYAIILFDDHVLTESSVEMYPDKMAVINALVENSGKKHFSDVICQADGGTTYAEPLRFSRTIFETGRPLATKELYFVSDGEPADESDGKAAADDLKTKGITIHQKTSPVTIATVMLKGAGDSVLRNDIASRDANGKPIHADAKDASDLAEKLGKLADNKLIGASLTYGPIRATDPKVIDLMPLLKGGDFTLPPFKLDLSDTLFGYDIRLEYWNSGDTHFATRGRLLFTD